MKIKTREVKDIVMATFPEYRKREVRIEPRDNVTFYDLNWSGGTKNEYKACHISGATNTRKLDMGRPAPWNNPYEGLTIQIPIDCLIIRAGYFCGQESMLTIFVNPANMPKFITA